MREESDTKFSGDHPADARETMRRSRMNAEAAHQRQERET